MCQQLWIINNFSRRTAFSLGVFEQLRYISSFLPVKLPQAPLAFSDTSRTITCEGTWDVGTAGYLWSQLSFQRACTDLSCGLYEVWAVGGGRLHTTLSQKNLITAEFDL